MPDIGPISMLWVAKRAILETHMARAMKTVTIMELTLFLALNVSILFLESFYSGRFAPVSLG